MSRIIVNLCLAVMVTAAYAADDWRSEGASKLNWQGADNICGGYFNYEFNEKTALQEGQRLIADEIDLSENKQIAKGNVQLKWVTGQLVSPHVFVANKSNGDSVATLLGPINYDAKNIRLVANHAKVNISNDRGVWDEVLYSSLLMGRFFWGSAQKLLVKDQRHWQLDDAELSICNVQQPLWHIKADKIFVDKQKGVVKAIDSVVYLTDVPIFAWPYLSFPLNKNRKTGWLVPKFSNQHYSGNVMHLPWYWNIAKNQDFKLIPMLIQNSGAGVAGIWRYLSDFGLTWLKVFLLPNDSGFSQFKSETLDFFSSDPTRQDGVIDLQHANNKRWSFAIKHKYFDEYNKISLNWQVAADNDITRHFPFVFDLIEMQYLPKYINWLYNSTHFSSNFSWAQWQVLHSLLWQPVANPYEAKPNWHGFKFYSFQNSQLSLHVDIGRFVVRPLAGHVDLPDGVRLLARPDLAWHTVVNNGLMQVNMTAHILTAHLTNSVKSNLSFFVPQLAVSWQAGTWLKNQYLQHAHLLFKTKYVWTPYKDQTGLPHFDIDWQPQFYQQLFSSNRFVGNDWLGDTNRISTGVELSSYDHQSAQQQWLVALGQGWAFTKHELCLDQQCIGDVWAKQSPSALQFLGKYNVVDNLQLNASIAWDWFGDSGVAGSVDAKVKLYNHEINLGYLALQFPQDSFFSNNMWHVDPHMRYINLGVKSNLSTNITSELNAHWDQARDQFADVGAELKWQGCCGALQLGLVRRYNKSFVENSFKFENRVYVKITLLSL